MKTNNPISLWIYLFLLLLVLLSFLLFLFCPFVLQVIWVIGVIGLFTWNRYRDPLFGYHDLLTGILIVLVVLSIGFNCCILPSVFSYLSSLSSSSSSSSHSTCTSSTCSNCVCSEMGPYWKWVGFLDSTTHLPVLQLQVRYTLSDPWKIVETIHS